MMVPSRSLETAFSIFGRVRQTHDQTAMHPSLEGEGGALMTDGSAPLESQHIH